MTEAGSERTSAHSFWAPIEYFYRLPALGDEERGIDLYHGEFEMAGNRWVGSVRLDTRKQPEPLASGERAADAKVDIARFLQVEAHWQEEEEFSILGQITLPSILKAGTDAVETSVGRGAGVKTVGKSIAGTEIGDGESLDRVSFLIPNGRFSFDGSLVCDNRRVLPGGTSTEVDGWSIRIHPRTDATLLVLKERQKSTAAHMITHVGEIRRIDRAKFEAADAKAVLDVVDTALTLYLGRAAACLLPVGWSGDAPVWCKWGGDRSISRRESDFNWFDEANGCETLTELISCCFAASKREDGIMDVIRLALGYLLSAHHGTVQMRVALSVAALNLVAEEWHVAFSPAGERYSRGSFQGLGTVDRIRLMLKTICMTPAIPADLPHFVALQTSMQAVADAERATSKSVPHGGGAKVDAVKCIVSLRNEVEHPSKRRRMHHDIRQWAEAGFFATDALLLCVLFLLGYRGTYLGLSSANRYRGAGRAVPWTNWGQRS